MILYNAINKEKSLKSTLSLYNVLLNMCVLRKSSKPFVSFENFCNNILGPKLNFEGGLGG